MRVLNEIYQTLIDQVFAASLAKPREICLPRAPNVFGRAPRLDSRTQLRARRQPVKTLGAELKLRGMHRADRHEHRDREPSRIIRRAIAQAQLEAAERNAAVIAQKQLKKPPESASNMAGKV